MDAIELSVNYNKFKDINKELNSKNRSMCQSKTVLIAGAKRSFILSQIWMSSTMEHKFGLP